MARTMTVDLFVEDQAQEEFVGALVRRLARENARNVELRIRCARGGHGRATSELRLYQRSAEKGLGAVTVPDFLVIAIDANCKRPAEARREIEEALSDRFRPLAAIACPDPHIERWYVADPASFKTVVGASPRSARRKCERGYYKGILSQAVKQAGHVPTLGGIEFARELVDAMDFDRAAQTERGIKPFLQDLYRRFRTSGE